MLLEGGLDWKPMSLSPKDMDFIEAKHAAAREIALALGVPPMLLGIPGDNTYANYRRGQPRLLAPDGAAARRRARRRRSSIWLAPPSAPKLELRPDLDAVEALSAEREALWARLDEPAFLTANEKRAAVGYGPLDGRRQLLSQPSGSRSSNARTGYGPAQRRRRRGSASFAALTVIEEASPPTAAFEGYAMPVRAGEDLGGDIVMPGAFRRASLRGCHGMRLLFQHDPAEPVGAWTTSRGCAGASLCAAG